MQCRLNSQFCYIFHEQKLDLLHALLNLRDLKRIIGFRRHLRLIWQNHLRSGRPRKSVRINVYVIRINFQIL